MQFIDEAIEHYCLNKSSLPSALCSELEQYTQKNIPMSVMLSGPLVGSLLGMMIRMIKAKRVLEIGTFTGYSALCMAEQLPPEGVIETIDVNSEVQQVGKTFWQQSPHCKKITAHLGEALTIVPELKRQWDLVFIDADKQNYLNYLQMILDKNLLSAGGMIILDNCLWSGKVLLQEVDESTQAIQACNDYISSRNDLYATLIPIRDGLFLVTKI